MATATAMAQQSRGALRHIVLLKVANKEDVVEVVETLAKMGREIINHVSVLSFSVNSDIGAYISEKYICMQPILISIILNAQLLQNRSV